MRRASLPLLLCLSSAMPAQWTLQDAHTTADLRGIDNVGHGVAWASGNHGTVLRTLDNGATWQHCITPPDAETLDFRGIQAFGKDTAIVMSSGIGDLSRLYKTTDGCHTWKLLFTNPDKEGFWDAIRFAREPPVSVRAGVLVGDPVDGKRVVFVSQDEGVSWHRWAESTDPTETRCKRYASPAEKGEGLFAASNSSLYQWWGVHFAFVTGGTSGAKFVFQSGGDGDGTLPCRLKLSAVPLPLVRGESGGAFSLTSKEPLSFFPIEVMVVGGDYAHPDKMLGNAIFISTKRGEPLPGQRLFKATLSVTPPHGYRSAVAYDKPAKAWITVGPNGTDISIDDGRNWHALKPDPKHNDEPEADQHWNALSLPFVVGPKGRIGISREGALSTSSAATKQ